MKFMFFLMLLLSSSLALGKIEFNLDEICSQVRSDEQDSQNDGIDELSSSELLIVDQGFCDVYLETALEDTVYEALSLVAPDESVSEDEKSSIKEYASCENPTQILIKPLMPNDYLYNHTTGEGINPKKRWVVRFYASHSFTNYFKTDISFRSARYNVDVKDYQWAERGSREFFTLDHMKEHGEIYRLIDEPTNTFTVSISNGKFEYFLSVFHPKFLQGENQVKYMKGTIDGVAVDGVYPINRPFDGWNQELGEMELVRNQNTHLQLYFKGGVGYRVPLLNTKFMNITTVPSLALGVMAGQNLTVSIKEGEWWEFDDHLAPKFSVQGFGGTVANRLEFNLGKKRRFGLFYEAAYSFVKQEHEFMQMEDGSPGTQKYNLQFMENTVGITIKLFDTKNRKIRN